MEHENIGNESKSKKELTANKEEDPNNGETSLNEDDNNSTRRIIRIQNSRQNSATLSGLKSNHTDFLGHLSPFQEQENRINELLKEYNYLDPFYASNGPQRFYFNSYHVINKGFTVLMFAALNDNDYVVNKLLEQGNDVNAADKKGFTALIYAALSGHPDIVKLLLRQGAKVNAVNSDGKTALMEAAENGHADVVELLLKHEADVNIAAKDGWTAQMLAAKKGYVNIVKKLKKQNAEWWQFWK